MEWIVVRLLSYHNSKNININKKTRIKTPFFVMFRNNITKRRKEKKKS